MFECRAIVWVTDSTSSHEQVDVVGADDAGLRHAAKVAAMLAHPECAYEEWNVAIIGKIEVCDE